MPNGFNINEFLAKLTVAAGKELAGPFIKEVREWWLKQEYGVTVYAEEAESLKKIGEDSFYQLFKKYLGGHWSLKLIKVGIFVSRLNEEGRKKRAKKLCDEVYRSRKYGKRGQRIIQLASTGVLEPVMDYIIDLKLRKGANVLELHREFDEILDEWEKISVPVHAKSNEIDIKKNIQKTMGIKYPIFFVYAAGSASRIAQLTLAKMNNENIFQNKYLMFSKIKPINNVEYCLWTFEKVEEGYETIISKQIKK